MLYMSTEELVQWIRTLIHSNSIVKFYKGNLWRHLRQEVLDEQHGECQICKGKGLVETATMVHHIRHVRQHPELALTKENLMSLCNECHYQIHHTIKYKKQLNKEKW